MTRRRPGRGNRMRIAALAYFASLLAALPAVARAVDAPPANTSEAIVPRIDGLEVRHGLALMRVTALTDQVVRVRIAPDGVLPEDASWAVLPTIRAHHAPVTPLANGFATGAIRVVVDPSNLALTVTDLSGKVIVADSGSAALFRRDQVHTSQGAAAGRAYLRPRRQDRRLARPPREELRRLEHRRLRLRQLDRPDLQVDPLFHSDRRASGGSYGILLDNTWRSFVRFRPRCGRHAGDGRARRPDRLLRHRRPERARRGPALHRSHRQGAAAAAMGARLPAVALQLHVRRGGASDRRRPSRRTRSRPTSSGSTSTTRIGTARSPSTSRPFPI